jgi:hypothetical protein
MRKRRGIDLIPLPGISRSGNSDPCNGNDETDNDATEHEPSPRRQHTQK